VNRVFDAHALLAYFEKEPGHEIVQAALTRAVEKDSFILMTTVNFGEVYHVILKELGQQKADKIERIIRTLPIQIVDVDIDLAKEAARLKAKYTISFPDCFAVALARLRRAELLTGSKEIFQIKNEAKISGVSPWS
jgi:ribonuclease VapC